MLKALHLSSEKSWRGGEQQIAYLIEESIKAGIKVFVCCRKNSPFEEFCKQKKLDYIALSFSFDFDLITAWKIRSFALKHQVDLIHMHSARSHSSGVLAHVMGIKCPLILSKRTDFPVKSNWFSHFKYNYSAISKILCVSGKIQEIITPSIKNLSVLQTVYSGVDLNKISKKMVTSFLRKKYNIHSQAFLVGNTSALSTQKDPMTFLKVAKTCLDRGANAHFFLIGDGELRSELEHFIQENQLSDRIHLTGFLKNIPEVLPELDIFLMPSQTEGLGTALLDAMCAEVAIVATQTGGIPEIVVHEQTGLSAGVGDIQGLSDSVMRLIVDKELKLKIVQRAFNFVQKFSKENTAKKTFEAYQDSKA